MCLVHLPHIELLILLQCSINLVWLESPGRASLHDVCDLETSLLVVRAHVLDGGEDLVGDVRGLVRLVCRAEGIFGHLHESHGLIHILLVHYISQPQPCESCGQAENGEECSGRCERRVFVITCVLPHLHIRTSDVVSE